MGEMTATEEEWWRKLVGRMSRPDFELVLLKLDEVRAVENEACARIAEIENLPSPLREQLQTAIRARINKD